MGEGHAPGELLVVGGPGQDRPGRGVELGHDVRALARPRRSQDPFVVGEHTQAARPSALVGERQQRGLMAVEVEDEAVIKRHHRDEQGVGSEVGRPDERGAEQRGFRLVAHLGLECSHARRGQHQPAVEDAMALRPPGAFDIICRRPIFLENFRVERRGGVVTPDGIRRQQIEVPRPNDGDLAVG